MIRNQQIAQVNIARFKAAPSDPALAAMIARIDEINRLADESPGFVWRYRATDRTPEELLVFEDYFLPFELDRLFFNMSVWDNVEALLNYVYKTVHVQLLNSKHLWMDEIEKPALALWWIPTGKRPTVADARFRLGLIDRLGPTDQAFDFNFLRVGHDKK